jgi:tetratricopeptide (TPR) repeat protein
MTLYVLERFRANQNKYFLINIGVLALVWSNSHGSSLLLPVILAVYLIGDVLSDILMQKYSWYKPDEEVLTKSKRKTLLTAVVISILAPMLTPNGYLTYWYPFKISFGKFTRYVSEYQHFWEVWHGDWSDWVLGFTLILMIMQFGLFIICFKKLHIRDLMLGTMLTVLALQAVRHGAIFALMALYLIVRYSTVWFGEYRGIFRRTLRKDLLVLIVIVCFVYYYKTQIVAFELDMTEEDYPKAASEMINASGLPGNMFNHYNYGGYLIWKMPKYKVFIDGRLEMYEGQAGKDYTTILQAKPGYKILLDKYHINFFIMRIADKIVENLVIDPDWKYAYHDQEYVVFVKDSAENAEWLAKNWTSEKQRQFQKIYQTSLLRARSEEFNQRGIMAIKQGNIIAAMINFEGVVNNDPTNVSARLNLAQAYIDAGWIDKAKREYEYVLSKLDANNQTALGRMKELGQ